MITMNIITEKVAGLSNGFQSGEWVTFLKLTPEGGWEEEKAIGTGECTWHDDAKISGLEVELEGRGIVGSFYGVGPHSRQKNLTGFFGFTAEELAGPAPELGYTTQDHGFNAHRWESVETLGQYLEAKFLWNNFKAWKDLGDGVHSMPYHWGDQAADSFALIKGGKLIDSATGCGDCAPYLSESEEKCLADGRLYTSCRMVDMAVETAEWENDFRSAAEKLGLWSQYHDLCWGEEPYEHRQPKLAMLSKKIEEYMSHQVADERADADDTGILHRLLKHYRNRQNPLRSLRKEKGGIWTFHREFPAEVSQNTVVYHGDGWWITWQK